MEGLGRPIYDFFCFCFSVSFIFPFRGGKERCMCLYSFLSLLLRGVLFCIFICLYILISEGSWKISDITSPVSLFFIWGVWRFYLLHYLSWFYKLHDYSPLKSSFGLEVFPSRQPTFNSVLEGFNPSLLPSPFKRLLHFYCRIS